MKEKKTSKFIASFLDKLGISYRFAHPTGIIGEIKVKGWQENCPFKGRYWRFTYKED